MKYFQVVPLFLIVSYILLFVCIDLETYSEYYLSVIGKIDNVLVTIATTAFILGGFRVWDMIAIRAFASVILLNIITEIGLKIHIQHYYIAYAIITSNFLICFIVDVLINHNNNNERDNRRG